MKDKYDEIYDIIQRKTKVNINIQKKEENTIDKELQNLKNENKKLSKILLENDYEQDSENLKHLEIKGKEYIDEITNLEKLCINKLWNEIFSRIN